MATRILIADSIYPQAVAQARAATPDFDALASAVKVERVLRERFGTWDSLGHAFRRLGHEADDWLLGVAGDDARDDTVLLSSAYEVKIVQDVGRRSAEFWHAVAASCRMLVGIVNHKHPGIPTLAPFSLIATAFPHQVAEIEGAGITCRYLPCAFDPRHLEAPAPPRDLPVTFCGSLGYGNVWDAGTHTIARLAETIPGFAWWGPKVGPLTDGLRRTWRGEAFGRAYLDILRRSRLVVNRHGGTSFRQATNMRLYEATGMGACLLTEASDNLRPEHTELFVPWEECVTYGNPDELVTTVRQLLGNPDLAARIAAAGQARTLKDHTYTRRADVLAEWIAETSR